MEAKPEATPRNSQRTLIEKRPCRTISDRRRSGLLHSRTSTRNRFQSKQNVLANNVSETERRTKRKSSRTVPKMVVHSFLQNREGRNALLPKVNRYLRSAICVLPLGVMSPFTPSMDAQVSDERDREVARKTVEGATFLSEIGRASCRERV